MDARRMRRATGATAICLACGLAAGAARGQDGGETPPAAAAANDDLGGRIASGDLATAAKSLQDTAYADALRSSTARLRAAAEAAVGRAATSGQRAEFAAILDFLAKAGEAAAAANAQDADAWRTVAEARAAGLIDTAASGKKPPGDAWFPVAEAFEKAAAASPPGDDARRRSIRLLLESAGTVASQGNVIVSRALGATQKALKDAGPAPERRLAYAQTILDAAQVLVQTDRTGAREAVKAGHALLRPVHDGEKTAAEVAALWNRFVTFDRRSKFGVGEKYLVQRVRFVSSAYTIDLPVGPHWKLAGESSGTEKGDRGELRDATRLHRHGSGGERIAWAYCLIYGFDWTYRNPGSRAIIGGDNAGGIADLSVDRFGRAYFKEFAATKKPRKGKIGNGISAFSYQLDGIGSDGKPLRLFGWVFRGSAQQSFEFVYLDELPSDDPDPEFDAVLDSLREVG